MPISLEITFGNKPVYVLLRCHLHVVDSPQLHILLKLIEICTAFEDYPFSIQENW